MSSPTITSQKLFTVLNSLKAASFPLQIHIRAMMDDYFRRCVAVASLSGRTGIELERRRLLGQVLALKRQFDAAKGGVL